MTGLRLSSLSVKVAELSGGFGLTRQTKFRAGTESGVPAGRIPAVVLW